MKKINTFKLAVPVLQVSAKISHTTPRKPTVLERLILKLGQENLPQQYNDMSVATIFTQIFKIPNANEVMLSVLKNLTNLQILEGSFDDLNRVALGDIKLNDHPNTHYFIKNNELPAEPKANIANFKYCSVTKKLSPDITAEARDSHIIPTLSEKLIGNFFPENLIRDRLIPKNYPWLHKTSEITECSELKDTRQILYSDTSVDLIFDKDYLSLSSLDKGLNDLLNELDVEDYQELMEQVINQYNGQGLQAEPKAFLNITSGDYDQLHQLVDISENNYQPLQGKDALSFIAKQTKISPLYNAVASSQKLSKDSQVILYNDIRQLKLNLPNDSIGLTIKCSQEESIELNWDKCHAELNLPEFKLPRGIQWLEGNLLNNELTQLSVNDVQLQDKSKQVYTLQMIGERSLSNGDTLFDDLIEKLNSLETDITDKESWQRLRVFWVPATQLWREWLLSQPYGLTLKEDIKRLQQRYTWLSKNNKKDVVDLELVPDLFAYFYRSISGSLPLSFEGLKEAVEVAKLINPQDKKIKQLFVEWLQTNSQLPENYKQLNDYTKLISPFGNIESNSVWLHAELISTWQYSCGQDEYFRVLSDIPIGRALNNLDEAVKELEKALGDNWLKFIDNTQDISALTSKLYNSSESNQYQSKLKNFQRHYNKMIEQITTYPLSENDNTTEQPLIIRINTSTKRYLDAILKPDFLIDTASKVFVADSCFLIDFPNLPNKLKKGEVLLIPEKVHEELDNLKTKNDEKVATKARKAISCITENKKNNILTIEADLSKLTSAYESDKPDNFILASALNYEDYNPILLTQDKALINKSRGLGIPTLTVFEFKNDLEPKTQVIESI